LRELKSLSVTILACVLAISSYSQELKMAVELYLNSGGFPKSYPLGGGTSHISPRVRPGVGISLKGIARIGLYTDLNVRYINTGLTDRYHYRGTDQAYNSWYSVDRHEVFSFNKVSLGLGIGYRFKLLKPMFWITGGYRRAQYLSGSYTYTGRDGQGTEIDIYKSYNPFNNSNLDRQARRSGREIYFAAGIEFGSHLNCSLQYSFVSDIVFVENINGHNSDDFHAYVRNDAAICLGWTF